MNQGGTLILHANPQLTYTSDQNNYCGQAGLAACSLAVSTVPYDGMPRVLHVLATFPDTAQPRLKALSWGVAYDPARVVIAAHGPCGTGEFDIPDNGWPDNGTGIGQSWTSARTSSLNEIYWFAAYAYGAADTTSLRLTPHPLQGGVFVDDSEPPVEDPIAAYGWMGFGRGGSAPCPFPDLEEGGGDQAGEGSDLPEDSEGEGESEGDGQTEGEAGEPDDPGGGSNSPSDEWEALATNLVTVYVDYTALPFAARPSAPAVITSIQFRSDSTLAVLTATGAQTLHRTYPAFTPADTMATDHRGILVRVPDLAVYCTIRYSDASTAREAVSHLAMLEGFYAPAQEMNGRVAGVPDDPLFGTVPYQPVDCDSANTTCDLDPQWHLQNLGAREATSSKCRGAVTGVDIGITDYGRWPFPDETDPPSIIIGDVDTGIGYFGNTNLHDYHPDLDLVQLTPAERESLQKHPDCVYCTDHGTIMAGLAGARTDNALGIAGVCDGCQILDIEAAGCTAEQCSTHQSACDDIDSYFAKNAINYATRHFVDRGLRVLNLETTRSGFETDLLPVLWRSYILGVNLVAPVSDRSYSGPRDVRPANVPFVLGVGGHDHAGRFWEWNTTCYEQPDSNGTTAGPGVDICAPASPWIYSTRPAYLGGGYYWTSSQCSGAAAITAGAAGYLHLMAVALSGQRELPGPDDINGMILATARPFAEDPTAGSACTRCSADDYGRGMVDLGAALKALEDGFCWEGTSFLLHPRVAQWGDPGFSMDSVRTGWYQDAGQKPYVEYEVRARVWIPPTGDAGAPRYIAWANPVRNVRGDGTTTPLAYGPVPDRADRNRFLNAKLNRTITQCSLSPVGSDGWAELRGSNFSYRDSLDNLRFLVAPESLRMAYTFISLYDYEYDPAEVAERASGGKVGLRILPLANPSLVPIQLRYSLDHAAQVDVAVFDVSGRRVRRLLDAPSPAGIQVVAWDGRRSDGTPAPRGSYWMVVQAGTERAVKRVAVLR